MDFKKHQAVAIEAARKGSDVLQTRFGNISKVHKKMAQELVTEADTESETEIIKCISSFFPDHGILSEECGMLNSSSEYRWIIDPLDGTVNFAHGVPIFCISIALTFAGDVVLGVVFNPVLGELFAAISGKGAQLNSRPIQVSSVPAVSESLLVTGFPYNVNQIFDEVHTRCGNCLKAAQGLRRLGSAALDLCYVACGRFEGFWEQNLKPWDTAAGSLIALEAGGTVTTFANKPCSIDDGEILATNGHIHEEMLRLLEL